MSFYDAYLKYKNFSLENIFSSLKPGDPTNSLKKDKLGLSDFTNLISPLAGEHLEELAQKAHALTLKYFGKTIQLYTPIYLSNYCSNECLYCGFNLHNRITRKKLTLEELENEARFIYDTGLRHILILTGESKQESPLSYIKDCVGVLKKYFTSISVEIYALAVQEYAELVESGVDGLTIYQETYDEGIYDKVHLSGPKKDFRFRLDAPERAAICGMRSINIGALLGLNDWRQEVFYLGLHASYLQDKFSDIELSVSLPRLRPQTGNFTPEFEVSDENLVQAILALRLFLPRLGITISTRESSFLRDNLVSLGVTRMSAGSTTCVGGHTLDQPSRDSDSSSQFEISDKRTVPEMQAMLKEKGYQAVLKDWMQV